MDRYQLRLHGLMKEITDMREKAVTEGRDLTPDEESRVAAIVAEAKTLRGEIDLKAQVDRLGIAVDLRPNDGGEGKGSLSPLAFRKSDLESLHKAAQDGNQLRVKAVMDTATTPMGNAIAYDRDVHRFELEPFRLASLLPQEKAVASRIHYYRGETGATSAAAVGQGMPKPESTPTYSEVEAVVRKIAHYGRVTDEVLLYFGDFLNTVGSDFIAGLINEENRQLLAGNPGATGGNPNEIVGLLNTSGILAQPRGTDDFITALMRGITALRTGPAFTEPNAMVLHPRTWLTISLLKDSTGNFIASNPLLAGPSQFGGVPVHVTTQMPEGEALVANFAQACKLHVAQPPTLEVQPGGGLDEWRTNVTLIRAEEFIALQVHKPAALCRVTGLA